MVEELIEDEKANYPYETRLVTGELSRTTSEINKMLSEGWKLQKNHPQHVVSNATGFIHLIAVMFRQIK